MDHTFDPLSDIGPRWCVNCMQYVPECDGGECFPEEGKRLHAQISEHMTQVLRQAVETMERNQHGVSE